MSVIKNDQILLCCHFSKIIKGLGTIPVPSIEPKNHFRNVCHTTHLYLTKFQCDSIYLGFKRNKHKCNLHYVVMPMMMFEICGFHKNTKI